MGYQARTRLTVRTCNLSQATTVWGLQLARSYIDHLEIRGELVELEGEDPRRWQRASA